VLPGFFERLAAALNPDAAPDTDDAALTLARYVPSNYRLGRDNPDAYELQLAGLLRSGLLKRFESSPARWQVVTEREPTAAQTADAAFAWRVCGHVKSNAVVLARDGVAYGIGAGQQNRVEAAQIAASKADGRARGGSCASDAFYPFPDGIHAAADAGAAVIVQPGGSVNDNETIAAANERGIAMVFTAERQFLH